MFVFMKRTTLVLEDGCMDAVRELARKEGRQLSQVVNDLLIEGVRRRMQLVREEFDLPAFSMGRPRVNLADRHALEAVMDS
jgi:hypothetical protein